ncbi:hypothetical protein V6N13_064080 [Hibiscus sabdariffa]
MAEVAVNMVLEKLISFLNEEMQLLRDFHTEVADIKLELDFLSSFLRDADAKAATEGSDEAIKTWVKHVREAAYGIEDFIDEYMLSAVQHRDQQGFKAFLKRILGYIRSLKQEREMVSKIQDLKRSVHEIGEKRRRLDIHVSDQGGSSRGRIDPRAGLHFVESGELVGIQASRDELAGRLIDGESMRIVISLVGMGGLGKTTLAKKVYDDVKDIFDCHAWITVSQSNTTVERLRTMVRRFHEAKNDIPPIGINDVTDAEELIGKCRDYLQYKRYVIVFDDVWDEHFWQVIQSALPENNNGSRIIITTRYLSVAEFCKQSCLVHVHMLQQLSLEFAQELLCRTAFRFDQQKECPDNLESLSFDIARKCDGLPLAIVAIGGLLSTKGKDVLEWTRLCDDLKGLVKENQEMTLEETAKAYLTRLINRSLVQVEWSDSTGRARYCRAHDLIHEVLLSKLEELNLIPSSQASSNSAARYLWIDNNRACDLSRRNGSLVVEIPDEVRGLCNLQYLGAYSVDHDNHYNINTDQGIRINGSVIGSLESIEKLYYVEFQSQNGEHFGRELRRLTRLRKLGITKLKSDFGEALCCAIKQMHQLHALRISAVKEDEVLELKSMSPPPCLERLRLQGRLMTLPGWISELKNLVKVSLHWSGISDGSLKILGDLPKLSEVWLHECYDGAELHFEQGKFPKLKYLALRCLYKLEKLVIERGCLPCLETLGIGPSPLLQEVPTNIGNLECLKNLEFHDMAKEFAKKILPNEGLDYWKVKRIPNVCVHFTGRGLYGETYKLGDFRLRQYLYQT